MMTIDDRRCCGCNNACTRYYTEPGTGRVLPWCMSCPDELAVMICESARNPDGFLFSNYGTPGNTCLLYDVPPLGWFKVSDKHPVGLQFRGDSREDGVTTVVAVDSLGAPWHFSYDGKSYVTLKPPPLVKAASLSLGTFCLIPKRPGLWKKVYQTDEDSRFVRLGVAYEEGCDKDAYFAGEVTVVWSNQLRIQHCVLPTEAHTAPCLGCHKPTTKSFSSNEHVIPWCHEHSCPLDLAYLICNPQLNYSADVMQAKLKRYGATDPKRAGSLGWLYLSNLEWFEFNSVPVQFFTWRDKQCLALDGLGNCHDLGNLFGDTSDTKLVEPPLVPAAQVTVGSLCHLPTRIGLWRKIGNDFDHDPTAAVFTTALSGSNDARWMGNVIVVKAAERSAAVSPASDDVCPVCLGCECECAIDLNVYPNLEEELLEPQQVRECLGPEWTVMDPLFCYPQPVGSAWLCVTNSCPAVYLLRNDGARAVVQATRGDGLFRSLQQQREFLMLVKGFKDTAQCECPNGFTFISSERMRSGAVEEKLATINAQRAPEPPNQNARMVVLKERAPDPNAPKMRFSLPIEQLEGFLDHAFKDTGFTWRAVDFQNDLTESHPLATVKPGLSFQACFKGIDGKFVLTPHGDVSPHGTILCTLRDPIGWITQLRLDDTLKVIPIPTYCNRCEDVDFSPCNRQVVLGRPPDELFTGSCADCWSSNRDMLAPVPLPAPEPKQTTWEAWSSTFWEEL